MAADRNQAEALEMDGKKMTELTLDFSPLFIPLCHISSCIDHFKVVLSGIDFKFNCSFFDL